MGGNRCRVCGSHLRGRDAGAADLAPVLAGIHKRHGDPLCSFNPPSKPLPAKGKSGERFGRARGEILSSSTTMVEDRFSLISFSVPRNQGFWRFMVSRALIGQS